MIPIPVWRATFSPIRPSTGIASTVQVAGGGSRAAYVFSGTPWASGLVALPRFRAKVGFDANGWNGGVIPTTSSLDWAPSTKASYDAWAGNFYWKNTPVLVELGFEGFDGSAPAVWTTILNGTVDDIKAQDGIISLTIADLSAALNKPLISARFAGTGGIEGPTEAAQRIKRRSWGRVFNVPGQILDKANNIWEFGDPAFQLNAFVEVRDMGRAASPAPTLIAWQGSVAATFATLQAAAAPSGSCAVAPSIACVKWYTAPAGPLCADLLGEIGTGGYVETAPAIAERILLAAGGPALAAGELAAANGLRPDPAGFHASDETITPSEALDALLLSISMAWILEAAGTVRFRPFTFSGAAETIQSDTVQRIQILPPVSSRRLGYRLNNRIHNDGEISAGALPLLADSDPAAAAALSAATGKLGAIEDGADVTSMVQADKAQISISCDSSGTPNPDQFPLAVPVKLIRNGAIITSGIVWSYRIISGAANGLTSSGGSTAISGAGVNTFSLTSLEAPSAVVEVKAAVGTRERTATIQFDKVIPPPPTGGATGGGNSGGTSASDSSLSSIHLTTMAVISVELAVTVGSNGTVLLTASFSIDKSSGGPGGYPVWSVFDWWNGSAWADVGTEVQSNPDLLRVRDPDLGSITYTDTIGQLSISTSKTGLTPGSSQRFRLKARTGVSATTHVISGTATAQG